MPECGRPPGRLLPVLMIGLLLPVGLVVGEQGSTRKTRTTAVASAPVKAETRDDIGAPLLVRLDSRGTMRQGVLQAPVATLIDPTRIRSRELRDAAPGKLAFLETYRKALERESERQLDRDPSFSWTRVFNEQDPSPARMSREAERIFGRAHERILSQVLEGLIEGTASLKAARTYVDGVRLDVKKGGGVDMGSTLEEEPRSNVRASIGFIVAGKPRVEMKTDLLGKIRTRIEIPLSSPGFSTSMSQRLTKNLRGKMKMGMEEEDHWISLGLEYKF